MSPSTLDTASRQRLESRLRTVLEQLSRLADEAGANGLGRTEQALRAAQATLVETAKAQHGMAL